MPKTAAKKTAAKKTVAPNSGDELESGFDPKNRKVTLGKSGAKFSVTEPVTGLFYETENEATARNVFAHALTNSQAFAIEY